MIRGFFEEANMSHYDALKLHEQSKKHNNVKEYHLEAHPGRILIDHLFEGLN